METTVVLVACAVGGLLIGSFLTVVVDRVPRGGSVVAPPSACGACGTRLGPPDLVPVVSWVALRGRCRHCGTAIGVEPVVLEIATAAMFVLFGWHIGASAELPAFLILGAALIALTWVDLREKRLPREISYPALGLGAVALTVAALVNGEPERVAMMVGGAVLATLLLGGIHLASRGGMGSGDVRLAPLLGAYLGWLNPGLVPVGLFFGFVLGAVIGVVLLASGKAGRKTALPFGPFLALGTVLAVFVGQDAIDLLLTR